MPGHRVWGSPPRTGSPTTLCTVEHGRYSRSERGSDGVLLQWLILGLEAIADAVNRLDEPGVGGIILTFLAQLGDVAGPGFGSSLHTGSPRPRPAA